MFQTVEIDTADDALLRLGSLEEGCLADTLNSDLSDRMARCERLAAVGLLMRGEEYGLEDGGLVRTYHTTPAGLASQLAYWMAEAGFSDSCPVFVPHRAEAAAELMLGSTLEQASDQVVEPRSLLLCA